MIHNIRFVRAVKGLGFCYEKCSVVNPPNYDKAVIIISWILITPFGILRFDTN